MALVAPPPADSPGPPPVAPRLEFAFELWVALRPEVDHGRTPLGGRTRAPITGGHFRGPRIAGRVLGGGSDWQLLRADGWLELRAEYDLCATDGTLIHVRNHGLWHSPSGTWPADYALSTPRFEAPLGPHDWLNQAVFVAEVGLSERDPVGVVLRVWQVGPSPGP